MDSMNILYGLLVFAIVVNVANLWVMWAMRRREGMAEATEDVVLSRAIKRRLNGFLDPKANTRNVVERMDRVGGTNESKRLAAIRQIKRRFSGVINTDEEAEALIAEALVRVRAAKKAAESK